ncbi:40S ribosomal protein s21-1 [Phtheirospermum japonicum]|uniref:40S ribosomal protein s21-1 n=1 Tax=Phtheirospermum japonicum TaxID=374723 RepID=A0A830C5F5_9LAMI|nr:40S ribosomal protein s21-1 [Phtheirospermum japonicum]
MRRCRLTLGIWARMVFTLVNSQLLLFAVSSVLRVILTALWIASGRRRNLMSSSSVPSILWFSFFIF